MNTKTLMLMAVSALLSSSVVLASDHAVSAASHGAKDGSDANCSFVYSIQKIGQTLADAGDNMTYHVILSNVGDCRLREITVEDMLPRGVSFVSSNPAPSEVHERLLRWSDVEIKEGRYLDFEIQVKVDSHVDDDNRSLVNSACALTREIGIQICDSVTTTVTDDHHLAN